MRRIKSVLGVLAVLVVMVANATPAMAYGWWDNCYWSWSWWWGWYQTCDWNPGYGNYWGGGGWDNSGSQGSDWGNSGDNGGWQDNSGGQGSDWGS